MNAPLAILKGPAFTERLQAVCHTRPPVRPLPDLKYKRILIPGIVGGEDQFSLLAFSGEALRQRGAEVTALCCDAFLPACVCRKIDHHESACTRWCHANIVPFMKTIGLPTRWYSEFITAEEVSELQAIAAAVTPDEIPAYEWSGLPIGEHIERSIENYYKIGCMDPNNAEMVSKAREFVHAGMCLTMISERVLRELKIDKVLVNDGRKNDWGIIRSMARHLGIPVDVSLYGPRGLSVSFEHERPNQQFDHMPQWSVWREQPLDARQDASLDRYMNDRQTRPFAGRTHFDHTRPAPADAVRDRIGLPVETAGLVFGVFPNISYDGKESAEEPAFFTAADWVGETIAYFLDKPLHHLVVKVHPGEQVREVQDPTMGYLEDRFGPLPSNIHVIPPDADLIAHDVINQLDVVMVYTSTVSVEAAILGKPVIMVGGGRHGNRGITQDTRTADAYFAMLDDICQSGPPQPVNVDVARRYAYAAFFRTILPVTHFDSIDLRVTALNMESLDDLAPGGDDTIDAICRGVLFDEPIVIDYWPEESEAQPQATL
jgi:hypothetical protein